MGDISGWSLQLKTYTQVKKLHINTVGGTGLISVTRISNYLPGVVITINDPDARAVNVGQRFAWVNQDNPAFDFQRYSECSNYKATRIPPHFWRP
jgi:hypothetical protein